MGNGRLLFQDLSKGNIRVANPLQKMMSNESVLCSVRPNRKIFSGENQRHYFCFENLPGVWFFHSSGVLKNLFQKCNAPLLLLVTINYLGEMPLAGFHCIAEKIQTVYL